MRELRGAIAQLLVKANCLARGQFLVTGRGEEETGVWSAGSQPQVQDQGWEVCAGSQPQVQDQGWEGSSRRSLQLSFQPLGPTDKGWNVQGRLPEDLCQGSG